MLKLSPMRFILQTIDGYLVHDFTWAMLRAKEYYDWDGREDMTNVLSDISRVADAVDDPVLYVPVGSVEFVSEYLCRYFPAADPAVLLPLNVPTALFPFAGRRIANVKTPEDMSLFKDEKEVFVKSNTEIHSPWEGIYKILPGDSGRFFCGSQVSSVLDIRSEWRVFVFHGRILHAACYSGDALVFPDADAVRAMAAAYNGAPAAWTLDVAVTGDGRTAVLECHRFFSCGLYGFNDYARLPKMFSQTWFEMITTNR